MWIFFEPIEGKKCKSVQLQAWSVPEGSRKLRFTDYMTTAQNGGKVFSLTHRPPLPSGNTPGTHLCQRLSRPQGQSAIGRILCHCKIPMTPAEIEPATFRFVAQHLNHCATAVPRPKKGRIMKYTTVCGGINGDWAEILKKMYVLKYIYWRNI